ncbi:hypothetical protein [Aurantibacillus circumpalustris]|uniref:hypothetical protein n=1 Tax=Aurantibacillus circumpalustris TaxID=3036359 RepID=UPI00295A7C4E|nr:hypothetical protein [Aurantibacillus circumpalustris]
MKEPSIEEERNLLLKLASIPVDQRQDIIEENLYGYEGEEKTNLRKCFENIFYIIDQEKNKMSS